MLLDASVRGTIKRNNEDEVKEQIDKRFQNEYRSQIERGAKPKGVIELDANHVVLAQLVVIA